MCEYLGVNSCLFESIVEKPTDREKLDFRGRLCIAYQRN